ncbi:hypothetical protein COT62_03595 [Candidatus Roizmanbacteria bacterium CG09_land_8_20_14_0_10_41_9]|uniref:Uncharacterized protein n=1 Tax=Candidatus Roizmanbacteria bacterium CG09_land_8_20_14_0_10_41_9 TaxID=1974850 RepID=A0A2H0WS53_9BACT|nr:MAG: hypothetical protein COT62_03595 [Candidatus Roizmanbacteria bacterium CG09_land_8_20_14_0_10_41_9]
MQYFVQIKTNSRKECVEKIDETHLKVTVNVPPHKGKANGKVIDFLASYFDISPSRIHIISGLKNKNKIVSII